MQGHWAAVMNTRKTQEEGLELFVLPGSPKSHGSADICWKRYQQDANLRQRVGTFGHSSWRTAETTTDDISHSSRTPIATATLTHCCRAAVHGLEDIKSV